MSKQPKLKLPPLPAWLQNGAHVPQEHPTTLAVRKTVSEQLAELYPDEPENNNTTTPLAQVASFLVFYEVPTLKFKARLLIHNTRATAITYRVTSSHAALRVVADIGFVCPNTKSYVSVYTERNQHDWYMKDLVGQKYVVQVIPLPNCHPTSLAPLKCYWKRFIGVPGVETHVVNRFMMYKSPLGVTSFTEGNLAFLPPNNVVEEVPQQQESDWLNLENNFQYLGVGLRSATRILNEVYRKHCAVSSQAPSTDVGPIAGIPVFMLISLGSVIVTTSVFIYFLSRFF